MTSTQTTQQTPPIMPLMAVLGYGYKAYADLRYKHFLMYCIKASSEKYLPLHMLVNSIGLYNWFQAQWRKDVETPINEYCEPYAELGLIEKKQLLALITDYAAPINDNYPGAILKEIAL